MLYSYEHPDWLQRDPVRQLKLPDETAGDWIRFHSHGGAQKDFGVHLLNQIGLSNITNQNGKTFIEVKEQVLMDDGILMWPRENLILCLPDNLPQTQEVIDRISELRKRSFIIGVRFKNIHDQIHVLRMTSVVMLDAEQTEHHDLENAVMSLKRMPFKFFFVNVNSHDAWVIAKRANAQWIHGGYSPDTVPSRGLHPHHETYIQLLSALRKEFPIHEIESLFKRDVIMTSRLFNFLGAPGSGYAHMKINNIRKAIISIGYQPLYRWLSTTWFSFSPTLKQVGQEQSLLRARTCELLGKTDNLSQEEQDNLFLVGLFSNIHLMLGVPMEQALNGNYFPEVVINSIRNPYSQYGSYLCDAVHCEISRASNCHNILNMPFHTGTELTVSMLESLSWVRRLRGSMR
jgi:EAL and modified HD-GYP domain-containing signal transduction protein